MRLPAAALVALALLSATLVAPAPARAAESAAVKVLFDLGDGAYSWSAVTIPDRFAENASWSATVLGAAQNQLLVTSRWYPGLGVAVFDIGNRNGPSGFAGLFLWNASGHVWEPSGVGISSLILADGDAIAWSNAAYDSVNFEVRPPVPTPDSPYPALGFRGDGVGTGDANLQAVGTGTSASAAPDRSTVLWERGLGTREIVSSPAVAYGSVYIETLDGFYALDDFTGQVRWRNPDVKGFSSPAVFDGSIVVGASDGRIYRLAARDGTQIWNRTLVAQPRFSGITSSPRVWMDWVYVGTFNETGGPGEVVSLWVSNGTVAWRHPTGSIHYSSPAIMRGVVYVGVMGLYNTSTNVSFDPPYGLLALSALDGTERWFSRTGGPVAASPLVAGDVVIVPSKDGFLHGIRVSDGAESWRTDVDAGVSSPALFRTTVFVGGGSLQGSGRVTAIDLPTGSVKWTFVPNGPVQSSISYADGKVFFSTNTDQGTIYAVNASTGELIWSYRPSPAEYILASPVVANGTVYAASDNGHVYAFRGGSVSAPSQVPLLIAGVGIIAAVVVALVVILWRRSRRRANP